MKQPVSDGLSTELPLVAPLRQEPPRTISESKPQNPTPPSTLAPILVISGNRWPDRILGIDIENGPDWYGGGDFVYDRIFCLSFKWVNDPEVHTVWIEWEWKDATIRRLLQPLADAMTEADVFLGHNFRHDWKGLGGLFRDIGTDPIPRKKPVIDTMRCIPAGIPRSLEDLCKRWDLGEKPHLSNRDWTLALRRKVPEKIELVKHRNRTDVILTERLYHKEREIGWLTNRTRMR